MKHIVEILIYYLLYYLQRVIFLKCYCFKMLNYNKKRKMLLLLIHAYGKQKVSKILTYVL